MKPIKKLLFLSLLLAIISGACKTVYSAASSASTLTPALSATVIIQPTVTELTPQQTLTATDLPSVPQQPSPDLGIAEASILKMLNDGLGPAAILQNFQNPNLEVQIKPVDINNDAVDELVIMLRSGTVNLDDCKSDILVLMRDSRAGYQVEYSKGFQLTVEPKVAAIDDVNNDKQSEIILQSLFYTPTGICEINVLVLGWQNDQVVNLFSEVPPESSCPAEVKLGQKINGYRELLIQGSSSGTWGGGPGRETEVVYAFKDNQYQKTITRLLPSNLRIHVLQDAQIASDAKNNVLALQLWDKAAHDTTLENFPSLPLTTEDKPEIYQPAYALYRTYGLYLLLGQEKQAQKVFDELNAKYPENTPGGEFIGISRKIKTLLAGSQDPEIVCPAIYDFISTTYPDDFWIYRWDWGSNNQNIVNFCPLHW
jgi:hypothetical protein